MRWAIIINPNSGKKKGIKFSQNVQRWIQTLELDAVCWIWEFPEQIETLVERARVEGYQGVAAAGGDGTVHHIGTRLIGTELVLGIIPLGTGNAIARHLKIPLKPYEALKRLKLGNSINFDVGLVDDKPFLGFWGVGIDAEVAYQIPKLRKKNFFRYFWLTTKAYFKTSAETCSVCINREVNQYTIRMLSACNISQYGYGLRIAPAACSNDGQLNLIIIKKHSFWAIPLLIFFSFLRAYDRLYFYEQFTFTECQIIRHKPGLAQLDGESIVTTQTINLKILPNAIKIHA